MDNISRKKAGLPYRYDDPALLGDQHVFQNKMIEYNQTLPTEIEKRQKLLVEVFAEIGVVGMFMLGKEHILIQMLHLWMTNTYISATVV
jgi:hypothetical protein